MSKKTKKSGIQLTQATTTYSGPVDAQRLNILPSLATKGFPFDKTKRTPSITSQSKSSEQDGPVSPDKFPCYGDIDETHFMCKEVCKFTELCRIKSTPQGCITVWDEKKEENFLQDDNYLG